MDAGSSGDDAALATLHVWHVPGREVLRAAARMRLDQPGLRATPGLRFFKLLGTSRGRTFAVTEAELRRWALFATWDSQAALDAFEQGPLARRWADMADERWRAALRPMRWRGRWSGRDPFDGFVSPLPWDGPVAVLTRARIRTRKTLAFWRAVPPVSQVLHEHSGLRLALGVGELPVGVQGTFSVWQSAEAMTMFAYASSAHREAIQRTDSEAWYAEELFARLAVTDSEGTVDGRDPLQLSAAT